MPVATMSGQDSMPTLGGTAASSRDSARRTPFLHRNSRFDRPQDLVSAIRRGRPVVVCDNEDRENEGDLVFAAQFATPALVNMMIRGCGGLICVALASSLSTRLGLEPMVPRNTCPRSTAFTASVDAAAGIGTGISARDRATTIRLLADPHARPSDFVVPGHVFPLVARNRGLAERQGHTEAAVCLAEAGGIHAAAAICEILNTEGEPMQRDELLTFAHDHGFPIGTVHDLAKWCSVGTGDHG